MSKGAGGMERIARSSSTVISLAPGALATAGSRSTAAGARSAIMLAVSRSVSCDEVGTGTIPAAIAPR